ncbi:hypothetical protein A3J20_01415 [Candidatus Gottesmanbacteria bacterium RIFCSPLOWO2_02_FULL_42_29]|uniref:SUF system FeS cluster assembly SufBD core domain-containing protein n=2 Tax=Candidatus Gottesmaniibacteriota TaxID=1752720 RepID=A0A1F6BF20_9BACT|nr:MAG: Iron-regulated ABC transporter permease protein SufD [Candidatus Gottesmanbacteria bacterium GW2011_GWA2_42_18]KKS73590.1 MAG: Iron-regulated ABC transporter permease protein SufD [Candidatus Gottesmanbacteria bacterium GW2011_GWC2_42_8]OGG12103.1 MAG: hypothetical protein A2781_03485 [Candidatus Gottesmanbacteria bacterium RIFCSPHIGHO2_01_FULL_42_27]OGG21459.1 MAG: hypothetical protein A3E72_00235 [Candidatus Gottesmanbacteria bacterium RIFCSPHIGHO2_12_FULL_43_26]OGG34074.1 MAG: hypoth
MNNIILIDSLTGQKKFTVGQNEKKTFVLYLAGDDDQTGQIEIAIKGSGSDAEIIGLILGHGKQVLRLYTLQDHQKEESVSDLLIKSVLFGSAKFFYEGLIKIGKGARKSNAYQKNDNILMSKGTWADSRPKLEILANDVRCTHGATVGRLNDLQRYYLKTRGLSESQCSVLMLSGFYRDALQRIEDENLREQLVRDLDTKIKRLVV